MGIISSFFSELMQGSAFSVTSRSVGTFVFDVVTSETHESELRITENPIESGALIADHAILEPKEITIEAVMVSYEPPQFAQDQIGKLFGRDLGFLNNLPLPTSIKAVTDQAMGMANRYIGSAINAITSLVRPLAPWLPDKLQFLNDLSPSMDRVSKALNELEKIQKSGEPITVQTGIRQYENMVLVGIGVQQTDDNSAEFYLHLREILIVETQTAEGLDVNAPKSARSAAQSAKPAQKGKTNPKASTGSKGGGNGGKEQTTLKQLGNTVRGLMGM